MSHTPPNNHHTNDSIDFPNEFEEIRFLKAEFQHARLEILSRERFAVCGCACPPCQHARADDGPECGSPAWRSPR
jgi:hypothetical protein